MGSKTITQGIADTVKVRSVEGGKRYELKFRVKVKEAGQEVRLVHVIWIAGEDPADRLTDGQHVRVAGKVTDDEITSPLVIYNQSTKSFVKPPPGIPLWAKIGLVLPVALLLVSAILFITVADVKVTIWLYALLIPLLVVFVAVHAAIIYRLFARGLAEWFGLTERGIPTEITWSAGCSLGFFILAIILKVPGAEMLIPYLLLAASLLALGTYVVLFLVKSDKPKKEKRLWALIAALCLVVVVVTMAVVPAKPPAVVPTVTFGTVELKPFPVKLERSAEVVGEHDATVVADREGKVASLTDKCKINATVKKDDILLKVEYYDYANVVEAQKRLWAAKEALAELMGKVIDVLRKGGIDPRESLTEAVPGRLPERVPTDTRFKAFDEAGEPLKTSDRASLARRDTGLTPAPYTRAPVVPDRKALDLDRFVRVKPEPTRIDAAKLYDYITKGGLRGDLANKRPANSVDILQTCDLYKKVYERYAELVKQGEPRPERRFKDYKSPVAGSVTKVNVGVNTEFKTGAELITIAAGRAAEVEIVDAKKLAWVEVGQPAEVILGSKRYTRSVTGVNRESKVVGISLEGIAGLIPGMKGTVIISGEEVAAVVSSTAVVTCDDRRGVFVPEKRGDGSIVARLVDVTFGKETDGQIEIVKGLGAGAAIITGPEDALAKLKDGDEVAFIP